MEYFENDLSLPCSGLKVETKLKTKFCLRLFMNLILSKYKFCPNFMTNFLTFKTFILDLKTNVVQVFHWGWPVGNCVFFESREQCLQGRLGSVVISRPVGESR